MATRLPPLIIGALLACVVVASAEKPTPTPGPLTEEQVRQTLERIVIPKLEFHEATLREAIDFLSQEAKRLDPKKRGVPFHVHRELSPAALAAYQRAGPPSGIPATPEPAPAPSNPEDEKITLSLTHISLSDALYNVTGSAGLKFRIRPDGVHIVSALEPDPMVTRDIRISAFFAALDKQDRIDKTTKSTWIRANPHDYLINKGVAFSEGAAVILNDGATRLTIHNTKEQIDLVENILKSWRPPKSPRALWEEEQRLRHSEKEKATKLKAKAQTILLPEVALENVGLTEALRQLAELAVRHDTTSPPEQRGLPIVVRKDTGEWKYFPQPPGDPPSASGAQLPAVPGVPGLEPQPTATEEDNPKIFYSAKGVSLWDAIEAIARLAQDEVVPESYAIRIAKPSRSLVTREYLLPPTGIRAGQFSLLHDADNDGLSESEIAQRWLVAGYVTSEFPPSFTYIESSHRLIVRNTEAKLRELEEKVDEWWREYAASEKAKKKSR